MPQLRWSLLQFLVPALLAPSSVAQITERVSLSSGGTQGNAGSQRASVSADGRFVAFWSEASNLVPGDTNGAGDIFVRDLLAGTTERVNVSTAGAQGNGYSYWPSISSDARHVAFSSLASNLVANDTNGISDIFVRDRLTATTERVSISSGGSQGNGSSLYPSISADGRFVAFSSWSSNFVAGDLNGLEDIFVRDRVAGTTERVSVSSGGLEGNGTSILPFISADGRHVAFQSVASNLVVGDTNGAEDVFVHDRLWGTTERASISSAGVQTSADSYAPRISTDGRFVGFNSAGSLVPGDTNGAVDVFVRDRQGGTTERVSVSTTGAQGNSSSSELSMSGDGRFVAFQSYASNLVSGDTNGQRDVFVHDRSLGTTERVSVWSFGAQGNDDSSQPSLSADGRFVAFESVASNLAPGDTNSVSDVFLHDRAAPPAFYTSYCDPGTGGVIACPCSNPPSGPGRGCDNSSTTGGASLGASGSAHLSADDVVFTTAGQKPTAFSIVLQGDATAASGVLFGQGVRCVDGNLKRLYLKAAVAGGITAPDFMAGDPSISVRSAALGDTILAGHSRYYLVYYRDPIVLGLCPDWRTFNATQSMQIYWWP